MSNKTYFAPGPSQLHPAVAPALNQALIEDVCSISHRSQTFKDIYKAADNNLRTLLNLPDNFQIIFTGSATEVWERIIKNCVEKTSFHFTNGSFSSKFYKYAVESGKEATEFNAPFGQGFDINEANIPADTELICFTHNETSSGVSVPLEDIYTIREQNPNALIAVDVVSSLPHPDFDYSKIDTLFFSVQKCFGMPSGLGVWIVNDKCVEKAKSLADKGLLIGPHHALPGLYKQASDYQTPATPNVLGIFTFAKVAEAMVDKGIETIREETKRKAEKLYSFIESSDLLGFAVENKKHRSETVVVATTKTPVGELNKYLEPYDLVLGSGYGKYKTTQIRIANFPAISEEVIDKLIDALNNYKG
ncbi:MAG: aminotransferase class V-fold PLP-dependent enzyme [Cytophagales bacterium]|nr:aminotransferase class V-fold PLP-dependent enzyme [Cytophagales bacterium]